MVFAYFGAKKKKTYDQRGECKGETINIEISSLLQGSFAKETYIFTPFEYIRSLIVCVRAPWIVKGSYVSRTYITNLHHELTSLTHITHSPHSLTSLTYITHLHHELTSRTYITHSPHSLTSLTYITHSHHSLTSLTHITHSPHTTYDERS